MIVADNILKYIPFDSLTRKQVAKLLGRSASGVDYYVRVGIRISEVERLKLKKEKNGEYLTKEVIEFSDKLKKLKP